MLSFVELVDTLNHFWSQKGVAIGQPYGMKVGAGTSNPLTALRVLGPEPFNVAYIEPSRRPADGRYGENPNRLQHYFQYQVILKPAPRFNTYLYIDMLKAIGIDSSRHDIRFVEDNWESPSLGAWGLGWEVWVDGMEVSQYTYFQQVAGIDLKLPALEITLGLERLAMYLQNVNHYQDIIWDSNLTYKDLYTKHEYWQSKFNYETSKPKLLQTLYQTYLETSQDQLKQLNYWAAYDNLLELSHVFNLIDARGLVSAADRVAKFKQMAKLANQVAKLYLKERRQLNYPLKKIKPIVYDLPVIKLKQAKSLDGEKGLYILEMGFEEIPADFLNNFVKQFNSDWLNLFLRQHYAGGFDKAEFLVTAQRLVVKLTGAKKQINLKQIIKGPPEKLAFDQDHKPTAILNKFMQKHEVDLDQITVKDGFVSLTQVKSISLKEVIQNLIDEILTFETDVKYMRWNDSDDRFIRPIRWLVSFLDDQLIPVTAFDLVPDKFSLTPRYQEPAKVRINSSHDYFAFVQRYNLINDPEKRRRIITAALPAKARINQKILAENVFLVESPKVIIHKLPEKYEKLPDQLVFNILEKHQHYLVFYQGESIHYAVVVNHQESKQARQIAKLNTKVVHARLDDGLFYLEKDLQRPLEKYRPDLARIVYHPQIGSYLDKVNRLKKLAKLVWVHPGQDVAEALALIKNDKATLSGKEFPEMEGVVGAHIAKIQAKPLSVVNILLDYTKPNPPTANSRLLAIIDLVDDIAALSSLAGLPKGNKDPYHIRNRVKRLIKIATQEDIDLDLILAKSLKLANNHKVSLKELTAYINKRFNAFLTKQTNLPHYLIQPITSSGGLNLYRKINLALQLAQLKDQKINQIYDAAKRMHNIIIKSKLTNLKSKTVDPGLLTTQSEKALYTFFNDSFLNAQIDADLLGQLADKLEAFFQDTFVLSDDLGIRTNRLILLTKIKQDLDKVFKYLE